MKKIFKKEFKTILALLLSLFSTNLMAQEMLFDLNGNPALGQYENYLRSQQYSSRAVGDTLELPFFDDFSEPFSRLQTAADLYPNSDRWLDNKAYINNHMAINPISQGVATFDGLDERGRAYGFGFALASLSDSLTSKPINLFGAMDTVYLSFYYQAQGMGNAPETADILLMEFKDTADVWNRVWEVEGYNLVDFKFNRVMLPVLGEEYLHAGFQFRFINYASRAGNVDHWHVDYIELDEGRSIIDIEVDDVAQLSQTSYVDTISEFQNATYSLLNEYAAMPWTHYKVDSIGSMGDTAYFMLRNNSSITVTPKFSLQVFDYLGNQRFDVLGRTGQVYAGVICGNESNTCNVIGGSTNFEFDISSLITSFPVDEEISQDSTFFTLQFSLATSDIVTTNDVRVEKQEFYNYFAYDDGTAEAAYGLGELENVGMVAMKYNLKKLDTLVGIQLYLNPVEFDLTDERVNLAVWTGNEQPEQLIWQSPDTNFYYTDQINYFYHYLINDTILPVSDNIWVGWIQQPATNLKFSVGFDKRTDASSKVFYNLGTTWNQSSIPGAVMIRPVVGQPYSWVGVGEEPTVQHIKVYPNPSTGDVYLEEAFSGQFRTAQITVYDISGRSVHAQTGYTGQLQLRHLHWGTYILRVDSKAGVFTERLVLQP